MVSCIHNGIEVYIYIKLNSLGYLNDKSAHDRRVLVVQPAGSGDNYFPTVRFLISENRVRSPGGRWAVGNAAWALLHTTSLTQDAIMGRLSVPHP